MKVKVCTWNSCKSKFSEYILERLENDKKFHNLKNLDVETCACTWNCKRWPVIEVDWNIEKYMNPLKASEIANGNKRK